MANKHQYKYKILFLAPYPVNKAPSQRLKYEQYYPHFEQAGFQIITSSFVNEKFWEIIYQKGNTLKKVYYIIIGYLKRIRDLFVLKRYDIVYIHLWATPIGPPVFEWLISLLAKRLIYDIDDMIYLGHVSSANKFWFRLKGRSKMIYLMKHANHVIVCSPKVNEFVKQYNTNTSDISSTINTNTFIPNNNYSNNQTIILGWSGSHSTSKYLHILDKILLKIVKEINFKLLVIGDPGFDIEGITVESIPWNESTEVSDLQRIDIGLYPLPYEDWVYGKSGIKAISYMALGIPPIATAIGTSHRVIEDGVIGFLVKTEDEWIEKIKLLIHNPDLRKQMGLKGREVVEKKFSIKANKNKYLQVLFQVMDIYSDYKFIRQ